MKTYRDLKQLMNSLSETELDKQMPLSIVDTLNSQRICDVLTDVSPMPFGMYKGVCMANLKDSYLQWLVDQNRGKTPTGQTKQVLDYIRTHTEIK